MNPETRRSNFVTLPGAIVIAGAMIAMAIIWVKSPATNKAAQNTAQAGAVGQINIRPVSAADHILGNPNAPLKIVEYSDPSCPFCKVFNATMTKIMDEYGPSGKVAWVYRNWPLDKPNDKGQILHKNAGHESQALECAAAVGGNDKFWAFEKHLYQVTPSVTGDTPEGLDQTKLPTLASDVGIDMKAFNDCLASGRYKDKVESDYTDGLNAGVTGTPYSLMIMADGTKIPIMGAQPYASVKNAIDTLLAAKE